MSVYKFCAEWTDGIASGEGPERVSHHIKSCNVFYNGRTIYSYGSHFPMAYILAPGVVWVNGDRFSNTTNRHQSELRNAIARVGAKSVIVPESALSAAGVDYRSIEPIDVQPERWEYTLQSSDTAPSDMSRVLGSEQTWYDFETKGYVTGVKPIEASYGEHDWRKHVDTSTYPDTTGVLSRDGSAQLVRFFNGLYHWYTARHWLGDSVFTAERETGWTAEHGTTRERVYFVSSFDHQERTPLYFLSQLPGPAATIDQAIESLAPDSVRTARDIGRDIKRQGDMFAIPMDVTTRWLKANNATIQRRTVTVEWRQHAREQIAQRDALETIKADMPAYPKRPYWSVGDDRDAFDSIYKQWQDDCDAWADKLVDAYHAKFPNLPQLSRWSWQSTLRYKPSRTHDATRGVDGAALYGTAHTATEVATLPDGRQFARGTMYHEPAVINETFRQRDHARRPLGKQWHLIARNTVPVTGTGRGRRR